MRAASQGAKLLTAVEGIYKEGLREARVIVTFLPAAPSGLSREEARDRMLSRMREGIPLGGPPYPTREEIYDRDRKA